MHRVQFVSNMPPLTIARSCPSVTTGGFQSLPTKLQQQQQQQQQQQHLMTKMEAVTATTATFLPIPTPAMQCDAGDVWPMTRDA
jgi:hypothetical protein